MPRRWGILCGCMLLAAGCATGRTEFRIIKARPTAPPTAQTTPEPAATPTAGETPAPTPAANGLTETAIAYTVKPGDNLWTICQQLLGNPLAYPQVAEANRIPNPDLIHPGQVLTLSFGQAPGPTPQAPSSLRPKTGAAIHPSASPTPTSLPTPQFPVRANAAFAPGEKLLFSVEYFGIAAGFATLEVLPGPIMNNRATWHLVATARTHPAFEWFFVVRDRIESFLDVGGIFSWRYEKHLREGGYSNDSEMIYDQINNRVIKDQGRTTVSAPAWTQDVLSEFYYFRILDMKVGDEITIPVVADDGKTYTLLVKVLRRETITVPSGKFDCLVVEPCLKFESVFRHQGQLYIWITADKRKVPVLIKSKIVIGTIDIVLRQAVVVDVP